MTPRTIIRLEGVLVGTGATTLYVLQGRSLLLFLALLLVPDVSVAGYLHSTRIGAATYNAAHTYLGPALLGVAGIVLAVGGALVWTAHIGADRLFGFGLKYADREFGDTHVQHL